MIRSDARSKIQKYLEAFGECFIYMNMDKEPLHILAKEVRRLEFSSDTVIIRFIPSSSIYPNDYKIKYIDVVKVK